MIYDNIDENFFRAELERIKKQGVTKTFTLFVMSAVARYRIEKPHLSSFAAMAEIMETQWAKIPEKDLKDLEKDFILDLLHAICYFRDRDADAKKIAEKSGYKITYEVPAKDKERLAAFERNLLLHLEKITGTKS